MIVSIFSAILPTYIKLKEYVIQFENVTPKISFKHLKIMEVANLLSDRCLKVFIRHSIYHPIPFYIIVLRQNIISAKAR